MIDYSKVDFSKILTRYDVKKQVVETPEQVAAKMMPKDPLMKAVAEAVLYKKLKDIMPAMQAAMAKNKPDTVINEGLVPGIEAVGTLYNDHVYYVEGVAHIPLGCWWQGELVEILTKILTGDSE